MKFVRRQWSVVGVGIGICLLTLLPGGCRWDIPDGTVDREAIDEALIPEFSEEVKDVLDRRLKLVEQLAAETLLVDAVRKANEESASLSDAEIQRRDKEWQETETTSDLVKSLTTNDCADRLVEFQDANRGFPEIFVTDAKGLIVAETNRTTDYVQSDEPWWNEAYNQGQGRSHYGHLDYDASAFSESISLNVPVLDPDNGKAIGVVKAVCDITAIKMEL